MSGPVNFMSRLDASLQTRRLPRYRIVMPATAEARDADLAEILIGRFDGLFMYRFTLAAAYNFVRSTKLQSLPRLKFLERGFLSSLAPIDRLAARHLNRRDVALKARADALVYQSRLSHREHLTFGGPDPVGKPVALIPNGVPLDVFRPLPRHETLAGSPRLAITAQFRLGKRLREAILVANRLRAHFPRLTLHVIGDMDRLVAESLDGLDRSACVFHGRVPSGTLPQLYAGMDIGLSPALLDPCPNSVIEMLACGLPVITTAASGAAELVPSPELIVPEERPLVWTELHNAHRIPALDEAAWVGAIDTVLQRRGHWHDVCLEHARRTFDIEVVASRYAEVIEAAAGLRAPQPT